MAKHSPRVLFINNTSKMGAGTSQSLLLLIRYLAADFQFSVVSTRESSELPQALAVYGIAHYALHDRTILYLPQLIGLIQREKIDLIYANNSSGRARMAFWASRLTCRPIIWHIRESLKSSRYARIIRFADGVIANSNDTAERLRKFAGIPNPIVISNGIDIQDFNLDRQLARNKLGIALGLEPDWTRVINVGRICTRKNQADVISVAREIVAHSPKTYFIIVGVAEQNYLNDLKDRVEQLGLRRNVFFCDYTHDIGYYLYGSDLMLHTSSRESQGRVLLEAMAARLPVVAYRVGGVGESIVDQETGFLLPFGDVNGLAQAIFSLIDDPDKRKCMGESGHQRVKEFFSAEKTAQAVREVINQVLQND